MPSLRFHVKEVCWSPYEQRLPILLQDKNGPCPLIALVNTLILADDVAKRTLGLQETATVTDEDDGEIGIRAGSSSSKDMDIIRTADPFQLDVSQLRRLLSVSVGASVEISLVLTCLGDLLLDIPTLSTQVVYELLEILPLLHTGLDVNPNLATGGFDTDEMAAQIFLAFGLNFVHGWCRSPNGNSRVDAVFAELQTFEAIQEYLLTLPGLALVKADVERWIRENPTQLTEAGLGRIEGRMGPDTLAIFFRNNHFLTLYKAENHGLYLLLTDDSFLRRPAYVWQSLNSVSGSEDLYFSGDFTPLLDGVGAGAGAGAGIGSLDENLILAQKLQMKEDSEYARMLQQKYERHAKRPAATRENPAVSGIPGNRPSKADSRADSRMDPNANPGRKDKNAAQRGGNTRSKTKDACVVM